MGVGKGIKLLVKVIGYCLIIYLFDGVNMLNYKSCCCDFNFSQGSFLGCVCVG